jgi:hypothetical protein
LPALPKVLAISEENLKQSTQVKQTSSMFTIKMINLGVAPAALERSSCDRARAGHQRDSERENGNVGSMFGQRLVRFTRLPVGPVAEDHPIRNPEKQESPRDLKGGDANAKLAQQPIPTQGKRHQDLCCDQRRADCDRPPGLLGQPMCRRQKGRYEADRIDDQQQRHEG